MKRKAIFNLVISLFIGLVLTISGISIVVNDTGIDINKSNVITGQVTRTQIEYLRSSNRKKRYDIVFDFILNNSVVDFTVYRSYENYSDLQTGIKVGDVLKVYYKPRSFDDRNVLQIEKNGKILQSYQSYDADASTQAELFLIMGIIFIATGTITYFHFNVFKFLDGLVAV